MAKFQLWVQDDLCGEWDQHELQNFRKASWRRGLRGIWNQDNLCPWSFWGRQCTVGLRWKDKPNMGGNKPQTSVVTIQASADRMKRRHLDRKVAYHTVKPSEAKQRKLTLNGGGGRIEQTDSAHNGCFSGSPDKELKREMSFQYYEKRE